MKKKVLTLKLAVSVLSALSIFACAKKGEKEKENAGSKVTDTLVGAYNTTLSSFALKDNPEAQKAFQAAFPKDYNGTRYEPIALLGSQVVSGMNYVYLCKSSWTDYQENISFVLLQIYQDLSGKSEVKGSALLFPTEESREDGEDYLYNTGSYQLKDNAEIENEVSPLLKTAATEYTPIAYIGKEADGKAKIVKTEDVAFPEF